MNKREQLKIAGQIDRLLADAAKLYRQLPSSIPHKRAGFRAALAQQGLPGGRSAEAETLGTGAVEFKAFIQFTSEQEN